MEHAGTAGSAGRPGLARPASNRLAIWALGAGLVAGAVAWLVGEATVEVFRPTMVTMDTPVGRMTAASAQEVMRTDMKNAALAFAVQGGCLGLAMGLAGGLARGSARAGAAAGLAGAVLGGALALGAAAALQPVYYRNVQLDQVEQGLTVPLLVHGGIWGAAGLAGGVGVRPGAGGGRSSIARAAVGGLAGVLLAAFVFEVTAAMAFPTAATTRPLSLTPGSRLMARMLASLLSAAGVAALLAGRAGGRRRDRSPHGPSRRRGHPWPDEPRAGNGGVPGSRHRAKQNGARHRVAATWPRSVSSRGDVRGAGRVAGRPGMEPPPDPGRGRVSTAQ